MSAVVAFKPGLAPSSLSEAERLGEEIAELCVYLHVAKAHLLGLIREFDEKRCWEELGFLNLIMFSIITILSITAMMVFIMDTLVNL